MASQDTWSGVAISGLVAAVAGVLCIIFRIVAGSGSTALEAADEQPSAFAAYAWSLAALRVSAALFFALAGRAVIRLAPSSGGVLQVGVAASIASLVAALLDITGTMAIAADLDGGDLSQVDAEAAYEALERTQAALGAAGAMATAAALFVFGAAVAAGHVDARWPAVPTLLGAGAAAAAAVLILVYGPFHVAAMTGVAGLALVVAAWAGHARSLVMAASD